MRLQSRTSLQSSLLSCVDGHASKMTFIGAGWHLLLSFDRRDWHTIAGYLYIPIIATVSLCFAALAHMRHCPSCFYFHCCRMCCFVWFSLLPCDNIFAALMSVVWPACLARLSCCCAKSSGQLTGQEFAAHRLFCLLLGCPQAVCSSNSLDLMFSRNDTTTDGLFMAREAHLGVEKGWVGVPILGRACSTEAL